MVSGKYWYSCIPYRLYCFGRLLLWLHCLHMFACLMILFDDRSVKYTEAFSMQCWIIILVICYSREWYGFASSHELCYPCIVVFFSFACCLNKYQDLKFFNERERAIHNLEFARILYVLHLYLLSLIIFALVLHLYILEHGGGFVLKKLLISHASLRLFWESLIAW